MRVEVAREASAQAGFESPNAIVRHELDLGYWRSDHERAERRPRTVRIGEEAVAIGIGVRLGGQANG
jgi:hypothetical protein